MPNPVSFLRMNVSAIDWPAWTPTESANLCFVIREGRILLIRKKRGLGAGKINGPGGRLEKGETPEQSAVRETQEELGVTPLSLEAVGELFFHFVDGYKLHVVVFAAAGCQGEPHETDEAVPLWTDIADIPYPEMWQDDPYWLPLLIGRRRFRGYFTFDGDRMLDRKVELL